MTDSCPLGPHPTGPKNPKNYDRYDTVTYTPYPRSIPLARRHVAQLTAAWGQPGAADDAALLTSELCTNALLHGCLRDRLFRVETSLIGNTLRVAVTDPRGERLPEPRAAEDGEQFGRGLLIVREVATRWAVEKLTVGKRVWAELEIPGGTGGTDA